MRRLQVFTVSLLVFLALVVPAWASDSFVWPVAGEVVTQFGVEEHRGIDVSANVGDIVVAAQDGVVYWIGKTPRGEPCISIDHSNGLSTTYMPVRASVSKGQTVRAGDGIGILSSEIDPSNNANHLHFGMFETVTRDNKTYFNPLEYLPQQSGYIENGEPVADAEVVPDYDETQVIADQQPSVLPLAAPVNIDEELFQGPVPASSITEQPAADTVATNTRAIDMSPKEGLSELAQAQTKPRQATLDSIAVTSGRISPAMAPVKGVAPTTGDVIGNAAASTPVQVPNKVIAGINEAQTMMDISVSKDLANNEIAMDRQVAFRKPVITNRVSSRANPIIENNPFNNSHKKEERSGVTKDDTIQSRASFVWVERLLSWNPLPEMIAVLAILMMLVLSLRQFVSNGRRIRVIASGIASATC